MIAGADHCRQDLGPNLPKVPDMNTKSRLAFAVCSHLGYPDWGAGRNRCVLRIRGDESSRQDTRLMTWNVKQLMAMSEVERVRGEVFASRDATPGALSRWDQVQHI